MEGLSVGMNLCLDLSVEGLSCCGSGLSCRFVLEWNWIVVGVCLWRICLGVGLFTGGLSVGLIFRGGLSWS